MSGTDDGWEDAFELEFQSIPKVLSRVEVSWRNLSDLTNSTIQTMFLMDLTLNSVVLKGVATCILDIQWIIYKRLATAESE